MEYEYNLDLGNGLNVDILYTEGENEYKYEIRDGIQLIGTFKLEYPEVNRGILIDIIGRMEDEGYLFY